jgi:hypothetical protein
MVSAFAFIVPQGHRILARHAVSGNRIKNKFVPQGTLKIFTTNIFHRIPHDVFEEPPHIPPEMFSSDDVQLDS